MLCSFETTVNSQSIIHFAIHRSRGKITRGKFQRFTEGNSKVLNFGNSKRVKSTQNSRTYFIGPRSQERVIRSESEGIKLFFNGNSGQERLIRTETPKSIQYYNGNKGQERLIRMEGANGSLYIFNGNRGKEKLFHVELSVM